jgi:hypothetical protein
MKIELEIEEIEVLMMACDKAINSWHDYTETSTAKNRMYFKSLARATEIVRTKLEDVT